jgi:hypothetical protein
MPAIGQAMDEILHALEQAKTVIEAPRLWDGRAAEPVGDVLATKAHASATGGV